MNNFVFFNQFFYYKKETYLTLIILIFSHNVMSLPEDAANPIDIAADSVEIDEGQSTSTYSGRVEASQGSMQLRADNVVVQHQPSRQPSKIVATGGPTRYSQKEQNGQQVKAQAGRMEYDILKEEIILIGDASLTRDRDSFSSDRIFYDRNRGIIKAGTSAQGHQRVHISIMPTATPKKSASAAKIKSQEDSTPPISLETPPIPPTPPVKGRAGKTSTKSYSRR